MKTNKLSMQNNMEDRHNYIYWLDPLYVPSGVAKLS